MAPQTEKSDNEDLLFLLSCLQNAETLDWKEVATLNGIADTKAVPAQKNAPRKFIGIVDASGKHKLENGKIVLKGSDAAVQNNPSTPTTPATGKRRGRPAVSRTAQATKKAKKSEEKVEGSGDEEEKEKETNDTRTGGSGGKEELKKEVDGEDGNGDEDEAGEDAV